MTKGIEVKVDMAAWTLSPFSYMSFFSQALLVLFSLCPTFSLLPSSFEGVHQQGVDSYRKDIGWPTLGLIQSVVHSLPRASQKPFQYSVHCMSCLLCSLLERVDCICKPDFSMCLSPPRAIFTKMLVSLMILSAMLSTQQLLLFPVPKRKPIPTLRTCQQYLQAMNLWQKKAGVWCLLLHRLPAPWKRWGLAVGTM